MATLRYRVRAGTPKWRWDVLDDTGEVLASGAADTDLEARAAAMQEAVRLADEPSPEIASPHLSHRT
jgi:hypothetical protein